MKILLTNDDGIYAEGLKHLVEWAKTKGEVVVVAPKSEQSGKSHSIEIHKGFGFKKVDLFEGVESYYVDSTPADCVRIAILGLKLKFDLVISGINRGFNLGGDICYSGTVGACFEGAHLGVKSIAFSTHWDNFDDADKNIDRAFQFINNHELLSYCDIVNVNFPKDGTIIIPTTAGEAIYSDDFDFNDEEDMVYPNLVCNYAGTTDLTLDTDSVMNGYISITPVSDRLTDEAAYDALVKRIKKENFSI